MSTPIYIRQGTAFRDSFVFRDAIGLVTGKTSADFTIRRSYNGVGNQSTADLTLSEVDATYNPGEYNVVSTNTGFVTQLGSHTISIVYTADTKYVWEQEYVVSAAGDYATTGPLFTSVTGNGRVTDGVSAISGATVIVIDSLGAITAVTTTRVDGNWGPVYFPADGTYTIIAQLAGYTQVTSSVVVSGNTVTGPGADIALALAVDNPLSAGNLWGYFTRMARDVAGTKADTERKEGVQDALDMVSKAQRWRWNLRRSFLTLWGYVQLSVICTKGSSNYTLSTGTWPVWANGAKIMVKQMIVDLRTGAGTATMTSPALWNDDSATFTATLFRDEYDLPDDVLAVHHLMPFQRWGWGGQAVSPEQFYSSQTVVDFAQRFPGMWTIHNKKILLYPYVQLDTQLAFTYYARPAQLLVDTQIADVDPNQVELLRRAIDYQAAIRYGTCVAGDAASCMARYKEALTHAEAGDRAPTELPSVMQTTSLWDARATRTDFHRRIY